VRVAHFTAPCDDFSVPERAEPSKYRITLAQLEASAHVKPEDMVEEVDAEGFEPFDPRGPEPGLGYLLAGG
jgi:hypothetical protein